MSAFRWIVASAILGMAADAMSADQVVVSYHEDLRNLSVQVHGGKGKFNNSSAADLTFEAFGRTFDLQLEHNDRLLSASAEAQLAPGVYVYRGRVAGSADSWARIVVANGIPRGLIWDGGELFAVEAPGDSAVEATAAKIYRLADMSISAGTMSCGMAGAASNGATMFKAMAGDLGGAITRGPGAVSQIDIGAIGDFEFTSSMGAGADAAILTRLNNVDGIFSQQLGVQLVVQELETFDVAADPFSDTTDASMLLDELGQYRFNTPAQSAQGLTHLYTGKDLDTSTVGIAYTGALCSSMFGAGLSEGRNGATTDSLIAAHEIGHNFGAPHDGVVGSACESEPQTFIMAPSINGSNQFSPCSIAEMQPHIAGASCIFPLPSVDPSVTFNGPPPVALVGNSASITFDAPNLGTQDATNVTVDITVPNIVSLISAASTAGTCTSGAGSVSCPLGTVTGMSTPLVTVTTMTTATGTGTFDATLTADADDDLTNNQASVQLTIDPAVELLINQPAGQTVMVDESVTVNVTLENQALLDASNVTLTTVLASGLRPDTATWTLGSCSIAAQQIICTGAAFTGLSSATFTLGATATSSGQKNVSMTVDSVEADRNTSNNSVSGTVTVNTPGGSNDDSSGPGAGGPVLLWLLGVVLLIRHRTRHV